MHWGRYSSTIYYIGPFARNCQEINTGFIRRDKIQKKGRNGDTWNANAEKWKSAKTQLACPNKDNAIFSSEENTLEGERSSLPADCWSLQKSVHFPDRRTELGQNRTNHSTAHRATRQPRHIASREADAGQREKTGLGVSQPALLQWLLNVWINARV